MVLLALFLTTSRNNLSKKMLYCIFFASCGLLPMAPAFPLPIEDFDSFHLSTMFLVGDGINYRSVVGKTGGNNVSKSGKSLKQS